MQELKIDIGPCEKDQIEKVETFLKNLESPYEIWYGPDLEEEPF